MSLSIPLFWQLLQDSRLLASEQCRQLAADFSQVKGAAEQATARTLAEWLVTRNVLSKYQMTILLAGRAGPFLYGDYKVYDRVEKGRLEGQFRAVHTATGHPVLLQFLSGPVLTDADLWAAAESLARAGAAILSPQLQRWFEPVNAQPYRFVVSEDLRGATAEERISVGRFSPAEGSRIVRQAALGLSQLHQAGRIHGDVRPSNLLLETIPGQGPNVKLLWSAFESPAPLNFAEPSASARLAAMADSLAPELAAQGYPPDALTDIYALGSTLYTLLTGNPPFAGGTIEQKLTRHATEAIRPLEQFGVPQPLAQLVAFMMAKNPAVRYQSATLVAEQLAAFVEPAALYAQPPPVPPTLPGYESFVRQRVSMTPQITPQLTPQAPLQTAPPPDFPVLGPRRVVFPVESLGVESFTNTGAAGPTFDIASFATVSSPAHRKPIFDATSFGGPAVPEPNSLAPPPVSSPLAASPVGVIVDSPAAPIKAMPAAMVQQRAVRQQRQQLATAAGVVAACVAVAIVSVVVLINLNALGGKPDGNQVAAVNPDTSVPPGDPTGKTSQAAAAVTPTSSGPSTTSVTAATSTPDSTVGAPSTGNPAAVTPSDGSFQQEVVPDDDKLLWASPTTGKPVSFRCVPPEGQVFLIVRPADLIASGEGEKVLQALGPTFATQRSAWEKAAGFGMAEIEQLIVTLHNNDAKFPRTSFVVKTRETLPPDQLLTRWNNPSATQEGMATYYATGPWAYYISSSPESERTFVMGEPRDVKEVAKAAGNPPVLFREVERLRRTTDASRHFTALFYPQFLQNDDGEPLFAAERAKVRQPLAWLLGEGLQAAAVSMHFGTEFYVEMRMLGSLDKEPFLLSAEIKSRLSQAPTAIEDYLVGLTPPPYWKKLSFRYPQMLQQLEGNLRVGVENEQAIVNGILPGAAAHNLVLGGELLIASAPGGGGTVATANPTQTKTAPKTLEEALGLKTTFSFDQQSLEFAMRDLAADAQGQLQGTGIEFVIKIIGDDLKVDGITRNQSVRDFKQEDKTIQQVLTALAMKANPVTTVKDPSEADQKLIWVIGPDPDDSAKQVILITTRAAAETKKYTLPAVFVAKDNGKKKGR